MLQQSPATMELNAALLACACKGRSDHPVRRMARGSCLVAVEGNKLAGLASRAIQPDQHSGDIFNGQLQPDAPIQPELHEAPRSLKGLAAQLLGGTTADGSALGLAAINALLPVPQDASPQKVQEIIALHGQGRRVTIVGHFPFLESLRSQCGHLDVLELIPRPGDLPASQAPNVLPKADMAVITGSSIVNGTLAGLLALCPPRCMVILAGPSAPFARCLFDMGVTAIAGSVVDNADAVFEGVTAGLPFRRLEGTRPLVWSREGLDK